MFNIPFLSIEFYRGSMLTNNIELVVKNDGNFWPRGYGYVIHDFKILLLYGCVSIVVTMLCIFPVFSIFYIILLKWNYDSGLSSSSTLLESESYPLFMRWNASRLIHNNINYEVSGYLDHMRYAGTIVCNNIPSSLLHNNRYRINLTTAC